MIGCRQSTGRQAGFRGGNVAFPQRPAMNRAVAILEMQNQDQSCDLISI
jgi:hypothetical protein